MTDDDREVEPRSNKECRALANQAKEYYGNRRRWPVDIRRVLNSGKILTVSGEKKLIYEVVDDSVLGDKDARTTQEGDAVKITAKRSVDQQAQWGVGRARMTLAHELGHGVMHATEGIVDNRQTGARGATGLSEIRPSRSAEHQAKVFASAFLIDDKRARELQSPSEISTEFVVSLEAAEICFERIQAEIERAESIERVEERSRSFRASIESRASDLKFLDATCPACHERTLVPLWAKVMCRSCGFIGDHPHSGDPS